MSTIAEKLKKLKGVEVNIPKFRMSYPYLFDQAEYEGQKVGWKVDALIPKDTDLTELKKAIVAVKTEAFGKDQKKWPKCEPLLKDGNDKEDQANYHDNFVMTLKSKKRRPIVVDKKKQEVDDESEVYGGRWARAAGVVKVVASGKTLYVVCYMNAVQLLEKGEPFGGARVDLDAAFGEAQDDADDESNYSDDTESESDELDGL